MGDVESAKKQVAKFEAKKKDVDRQKKAVEKIKSEISSLKKPLLFGKDKYEESLKKLKSSLATEEERLQPLSESLDSMKQEYDNAVKFFEQKAEEERQRIAAEKDSTLKKILEETLEIEVPDPPAFGSRILEYASATSTDYFGALKYIADTMGKNVNVLTTIVLVEKHKESEENLLAIVRDLNRLHEQGKVDFDDAAKFMSETFKIPIGQIMNLLFKC